MSVDFTKKNINKTFMNYLRLFFCAFIIFICAPAFAETDFQKIYDELEEADFEYIFGIDPYQAQEYTQYMFSPYPLLRTGVDFVFKNTVIPKGFYLLTPRKHEGKTYILFKESGRVKYMVPVYDVQMTMVESYDQYIPKKKMTKWQGFKAKVADTVGAAFPEKTQRKPMPKMYMEINDIDGEFYQMILYYDNSKYYLIFKQSE